MAEIKVNVDLAFSRRFFTVMGAAVLSLWAVPQLGSESLTLSTYYPAPMGVYLSMITTGNTKLGRDSSSVEIGGSAATGTRLTVMNGNVGIGTTSPSAPLQITGVGGTTVDLKTSGRMRTSSGVWLDPGQTQLFGSVDATTFGISNDPVANATNWRIRVNAAGTVFMGPVPSGSATESQEYLDVNGQIVGRAAILTLTLP